MIIAWASLTPAIKTVAMSFTVTPKETAADTAVILSLSGAETMMTRQGDRFLATLPVSIFADPTPEVAVESGGRRSHESLGSLGLLKDKFLPGFTVILGDPGRSVSVRHTDGKTLAVYQISGTEVRLEAYGGSGGDGAEPFSDLQALIVVDGQTAAAYSLLPEDDSATNGTYSCVVDQDIQLQPGQGLRFYVRVEDEYGLIHEMTMDQFTISNSGEPDWGDHSWQSNEAMIKDNSGRILWQPEY